MQSHAAKYLIKTCSVAANPATFEREEPNPFDRFRSRM